MTQNKKILLNEGCRKTVTPTLPAPNPLHIKVCPERGDEDEEGWEETVGSPGNIVLENQRHLDRTTPLNTKKEGPQQQGLGGGILEQRSLEPKRREAERRNWQEERPGNDSWEYFWYLDIIKHFLNVQHTVLSTLCATKYFPYCMSFNPDNNIRGRHYDYSLH